MDPSTWSNKAKTPRKSVLEVDLYARIGNDDPKTGLAVEILLLKPESDRSKYLGHPDTFLYAVE